MNSTQHNHQGLEALAPIFSAEQDSAHADPALLLCESELLNAVFAAQGQEKSDQTAG